MSLEIKDNQEIWSNLIRFLKETTGKKPNDLNSVLFLIGIQELGKGNLRFSKKRSRIFYILPFVKSSVLGDFIV